MVKIGEYQFLEIVREMPQGYYLYDPNDPEEDDVLMPNAYITNEMKIGDQLDVLVYCDSEDRDIATTEQSIITVGQFGFLEITAITEIGAFCDWGTSKDLLIPFSNQAHRLRVNQSCMVYMYLDDLTDRLVGTTKLDGILKRDADETIQMGKEVKIQVAAETDIGYKVIIDHEFLGLVYKNEVHTLLEIGDQRKAFIKPLRDDKKIDVSLEPIGVASIGNNEQLIIDMLKLNQGFLAFNDKSSPESIRQKFGISKKLFKKIIGSLYKKKRIKIDDDGIHSV